MEIRLFCPSLGIIAMSYHAQNGTCLQLVKFKTLEKNKINSFVQGPSNLGMSIFFCG